MRENAFSKARRYLTEGRLLIVEVNNSRVSALCRGDGSIYSLGLSPGNGWHCECPAVSRSCAHLQALRLVTVSNPLPRAQ
jgi:uncharacterized Zn finger protein